MAALLFAIGGMPFLVWGFFVRSVLVLHTTWLVNSATHVWGYRTHETRDHSTNLWWVALLTYGEGWHNNHHAFQTSARHGLRWWEVDMTYMAHQGDVLGRHGPLDQAAEDRPRRRGRRRVGHAAAAQEDLPSGKKRERGRSRRSRRARLIPCRPLPLQGSRPAAMMTGSFSAALAQRQSRGLITTMVTPGGNPRSQTG